MPVPKYLRAKPNCSGVSSEPFGTFAPAENDGLLNQRFFHASGAQKSTPFVGRWFALLQSACQLTLGLSLRSSIVRRMALAISAFGSRAKRYVVDACAIDDDGCPSSHRREAQTPASYSRDEDANATFGIPKFKHSGWRQTEHPLDSPRWLPRRRRWRRPTVAQAPRRGYCASRRRCCRRHVGRAIIVSGPCTWASSTSGRRCRRRPEPRPSAAFNFSSCLSRRALFSAHDSGRRAKESKPLSKGTSEASVVEAACQPCRCCGAWRSCGRSSTAGRT